MTNDHFASFLLGFGAGVGISMLLAPLSGRDTRELIETKVYQGRESVERGAERVGDLASELIEKGGALINAVEAGGSALLSNVGRVP
jgi:gas vesicle protein